VEERRKNAYRWLLYQAMLDIRSLAWLDRNWLNSWIPHYRRQELHRVQFAGAVADWLHNLALFSVTDFSHFNEEWFWRDFEGLRVRYPEFQLERYRLAFDDRIAKAERDGVTAAEAGAPPPR
jgi:hypothetical protein